MATLPDVPENVTTFIYAVRATNDPTFEYRYVGQTSRGLLRLRQHLLLAKRLNHPEFNTRKYTWMRHHFLQVTFDIIEIVDDSSLLNMCEMKWIHIFTDKGHRLVNHTLGGDGVRGYRFSHTEDTKRRISETTKGSRKSEETRRRMSEAQQKVIRKPRSPEVYKKIGEQNRGKKRSEEYKSAQSSRMLGNTNSLGTKRTTESREKISLSKIGSLNPRFGTKPSADTIEKRRATYHKNNHIGKGKTGPTCTYCLKDDLT